MLSCGRCGHDNGVQARFCSECAAPLTGALAGSGVPAQASVPPAVPQAGAPLTVTPGERRRISVLFADIDSSTALVFGRDPEEARTLVDGVMRTMVAAVHRFGGMVNRIAGDGLMALFGAPEPHEDHALRACMAALRMQHDVTQLHGRVADGGGVVRIRVGLNAGEVLVRTLVADLHAGYTAEGPTTHLAAKAEQAAPPGTVLVTADLLRLVAGQVRAGPAQPLEVKGLAAPIEVHELLGVGAAQTRFEAAAHRGLARFIGRQQELSLLDEIARRVADGMGLAVGVVGDAGLGKTRLLWEFRNGLAGDGWTVLSAHATAHGVRSPYFAVRGIVAAMFGIGAADDAAAVADKIRLGLGAAAQGLDLPPLLALLNRLDDASEWLLLDARQRGDRTRRALTDVIARGAAQRPTMLLVEDLHQADDETLDVIERLVGQLADAPLLLALEYRRDPDQKLSFDGKPRFRELRLAPLTEGAVAEMFVALAGHDRSLAPLRRRLVASVAGNPFFIEESVRMFGEDGTLVGRTGDYRLVSPKALARVPETVKDVLGARIARLAEVDRRVVQRAAVVGRDVPLVLLEPLLELNRDALRAALDRLVEAELLVPAVAAENTAAPGWRFKHAYTQETAYASMLRAEQLDIHRRLMRLLESHRAGGLPDRAELLAHHAVRAEHWNDAIDYLQQAARRAFERSAVRQTVRLLDEALDVAGRPPPEQRVPSWTVDVRLALRGPLVALGQIKRVSTEMATAACELEAIDDDERRCRVMVFTSCQHWFLGQHAAAVEVGRRALALAERLADPTLLYPVREYVGGALHALGDHAAAQAMLSANVDALPESAPGGLFGMAGMPAVYCRATRCWSREHVGDFAGAAEDAAAARRIARASRQGFSIQAASFAAGNLHLTRGEYPLAREVLAEGVAIARVERGMWLPMLGPLLALALAGLGDLEEARRLVDQTAPRPDEPVYTTPTMLNILDVYMAIGRVERAAHHAGKALRLARARQERICEAQALHLLGEIALRQDQPDPAAATGHFAAALDLATAMGMPPLAARCRLGLAESQVARGLADDAAREARRAREGFEALGLAAAARRAQRFERPAA